MPSSEKKTQTRTIAEINESLKSGDALVMTADELCRAVRKGKSIGFEDVHIVTAATCGLMSGTYAVLSFPLTTPDSFTRAVQLRLNGVDAYPGPCPNERLGIIDAIVHGTRRSIDDPGYGGGGLFQDIVAGKDIFAEVVDTDGGLHTGYINIHNMPHAKLHGSRHAFRNYVGFVNPSKDPVPTIFCSQPLPPDLAGATACGCGEINPIQKDPGLKTIGIGTRVLVNGGIGYVTGAGTRSSTQRPCLTVVADMHSMNPEYMGGFITSAGPEIIQTWAVPIPVLDADLLLTVKTLDEDIPLTMTDIRGRKPLADVCYADLWQNTARSFVFDPGQCRGYRRKCPDCPPAMLCPSHAFTDQKDGIDPKICFHCGICAVTCHGTCFTGNLGEVVVNNHSVPFIQRLSDRVTATAAASELKNRLRDGSFTLTQYLESIDPG
ncbi:MAG: methanogenesis marker 16 metalloprotein [Desulfobacteraceae bacterium]|nr:methanogenesis marker 16 metalloprotein [Desulfobacteraceae bacterium]